MTTTHPADYPTGVAIEIERVRRQVDQIVSFGRQYGADIPKEHAHYTALIKTLEASRRPGMGVPVPAVVPAKPDAKAVEAWVVEVVEVDAREGPRRRP